MHIEISERDGTGVVTISGRLEHSRCSELQTALEGLVLTERPRVAVDLSRVSYLDSSALGILVSALKSAQRRGGDLRLSGLNEMLMDVFRITRLSNIFQIHPTVWAAIESFKEVTDQESG